MKKHLFRRHLVTNNNSMLHLDSFHGFIFYLNSPLPPPADMKQTDQKVSSSEARKQLWQMFNLKINFSSSYQMYLSVHAKYFAPDIRFFCTNFARGVTQMEKYSRSKFGAISPGAKIETESWQFNQSFFKSGKLVLYTIMFQHHSFIGALKAFSTFTWLLWIWIVMSSHHISP